MITFTALRTRNNELKIVTTAIARNAAEREFISLYNQFTRCKFKTNETMPMLPAQSWLDLNTFVADNMSDEMIEKLNEYVYYFDYMIDPNSSRAGHQNCYAFEQAIKKAMA